MTLDSGDNPLVVAAPSECRPAAFWSESTTNRARRSRSHHCELRAGRRHGHRGERHRRRVPIPVAAARHLQGEDRPAGVPKRRRENVTVLVGQTTPLDLTMRGGNTGGNGDRDRDVTGGRHDERQRRRQSQRAAAAGHAWRRDIWAWWNTRCRACSSRGPTSAARRADCRALTTLAGPSAAELAVS